MIGFPISDRKGAKTTERDRPTMTFGYEAPKVPDQTGISFIYEHPTGNPSGGNYGLDPAQAHQPGLPLGLEPQHPSHQPGHHFGIETQQETNQPVHHFGLEAPGLNPQVYHPQLGMAIGQQDLDAGATGLGNRAEPDALGLQDLKD